MTPQEFLCDRCLALFDQHMVIQSDELCERCKAKMDKWLIDIFGGDAEPEEPYSTFTRFTKPR